MLTQLFIGSITIIVSMAVLVGILLAAMNLTRRIDVLFANHHLARYQFFVTISSAVILVLAANTVCVWIWAMLLFLLGIFSSLEEAVYFSISSFTTVGYGDLVVGRDWRVLSGFVSVNGLLAFGIFTAFLVEIFRELYAKNLVRK
jgi:hypothetical protein